MYSSEIFRFQANPHLALIVQWAVESTHVEVYASRCLRRGQLLDRHAERSCHDCTLSEVLAQGTRTSHGSPSTLLHPLRLAGAESRRPVLLLIRTASRASLAKPAIAAAVGGSGSDLSRYLGRCGSSVHLAVGGGGQQPGAGYRNTDYCGRWHRRQSASSDHTANSPGCAETGGYSHGHAHDGVIPCHPIPPIAFRPC